MKKQATDIQLAIPQIESGKRILIAGASGGIGLETVRLFAHSEVLIGTHYYRNVQPLRQLVEEGQLDQPQIQLFEADLTTVEASQKLVEAFVEWAGGVDVLVQLTGGIAQPTPWNELTEKQWKADIDLNLTTPFFLVQAVMKYMHMQASGGKIILTSTASARHGGGNTSLAYGVAKAGIECLAKGLARIGAPHNILVNTICPGFIDTKFHTRRMHRTEEDLRQRANLTPLKRAGTPLEVAGLIIFLASPLGNYITGECIPISGGDWL